MCPSPVQCFRLPLWCFTECRNHGNSPREVSISNSPCSSNMFPWCWQIAAAFLPCLLSTFPSMLQPPVDLEPCWISLWDLCACACGWPKLWQAVDLLWIPLRKMLEVVRRRRDVCLKDDDLPPCHTRFTCYTCQPRSQLAAKVWHFLCDSNGKEMDLWIFSMWVSAENTELAIIVYIFPFIAVILHPCSH